MNSIEPPQETGAEAAAAPVPSRRSRVAGAEATAAPVGSAWRPIVVRAMLGALALLGLSGIGAVSMLAGLDGAHASPPPESSVWAAGASASTRSGPSPVPRVSGAAGASATAQPPSIVPCAALTDDGRVILNLAQAEDLRKIPGIGPKRADAILALRAKLKRFKRPTDLLRVRGIGPKSLARMQAHFVVDPPAGSGCDPAVLTPTSPR